MFMRLLRSWLKGTGIEGIHSYHSKLICCCHIFCQIWTSKIDKADIPWYELTYQGLLQVFSIWQGLCYTLLAHKLAYFYMLFQNSLQSIDWKIHEHTVETTSFTTLFIWKYEWSHNKDAFVLMYMTTLWWALSKYSLSVYSQPSATPTFSPSSRLNSTGGYPDPSWWWYTKW